MGLLNLLGLNDYTKSIKSEDLVIDLDVNLRRCGIKSKLIVQGKDQDLHISVRSLLLNRASTRHYSGSTNWLLAMRDQ